MCGCSPGFVGNAFEECTSRPPEQAVTEELDPCANSFCGSFANQRVQGGRCVCTCLAGYFGAPPNCRPECVVSSDCPQDRACLNQRCVDPCPGRCGVNARCQVISHHPICTCPPNYDGDPFTNCVRKPDVVAPPPAGPVNPCNPSPCGPFASCKPLRETPMCSCNAGYQGSPPNCRPECLINDECPKIQACIKQRCLDPCSGACGLNAECEPRNHIAIFKCPVGYEGDPFRQCNKIPEVLTPQPVEAPRDPCFPSPCGSNAECKAQANGATCTCIRGYFGDPYSNCRPECTVNSDCPADKACGNLKCIDPCVGTCGINAKCQVVNHLATCTCRNGYRGDPFTQCTPIPGESNPHRGNNVFLVLISTDCILSACLFC